MLWIGAVFFLRDRQALCGILIFVSDFITTALCQVCSVADSDMGIRLGDYQMYISGERLESSAGVFSWFISPVTTIVGLLIPLIVLKSGFNTNWDVLFIDSARFGIMAVPVAIDLIGHVLMIIPYLFWDYNNEQHNYVMEVLKQREKLANEGYFPAEYEGGLNFMEASAIKNTIPVNSEEMLKRREEMKQAEEQTAE